MTYISHNRETLDTQGFYRKLGRLDREIGRSKRLDTLESDFKLDAALMGSGYLLGLGKAEDVELDYNVGDIDLYVPEDSLEELNKMGKTDPATEELSIVNPNGNWNQGLIVECFSGLSDPGFSGEEKEYVENELEKSIEEPFRTVYEGENLEVTLPDPETYAATKNPTTEDKGQKYREQIETIEEILNEPALQEEELQYSLAP